MDLFDLKRANKKGIQEKLCTLRGLSNRAKIYKDILYCPHKKGQIAIVKDILVSSSLQTLGSWHNKLFYDPMVSISLSELKLLTTCCP